VFNDQLDPLNPRVFPEDPNSSVDLSSVLDTPGAPDETWVRRTPTRRGAVEQKKAGSKLLGVESDIWVYTPPGYAAVAGPYPLLILFDGESYVRPDFNDAVRTLDNLISDGLMRPVVVCFVDSLFRRLSPGNPYGDALVTYGDAIAGELLPQLRSTYAVSSSARDTVIGGFSAGGLLASLIAHRHSDVFGNVLAQSGFFRARKQGGEEPTSIAQMYLEEPRVPVRFYLETGLYENVPSATLPLHEMALDEGITASNRHFRDVLIAKGYQVIYRETPGAHESVHWRATLADALMTLFTRVE
jgi:enterochelin esterase family protein